jgi:hypothetical protein
MDIALSQSPRELNRVGPDAARGISSHQNTFGVSMDHAVIVISNCGSGMRATAALKTGRSSSPLILETVCLLPN